MRSSSPFRRAPRPATASNTSPRHGSATTPTTGTPSTTRARENELQGRPLAKFVVPSTGSRYQHGSPSAASPPSSSPTNRKCGNRRPTTSRTCRSIPVSTSVTRSAGPCLVSIEPGSIDRVTSIAHSPSSRAVASTAPVSTADGASASSLAVAAGAVMVAASRTCWKWDSRLVVRQSTPSSSAQRIPCSSSTVQVATWTVDDEHGMRWALELGVDCLTTNRLSHFQQVRDAATMTAPAATARDEADAPSAVDTGAVLATARELGEWAFDVPRSMDPGSIETKQGPADLVTEVDTGIERHVRDVVGRRFPHFRFVGEELGGDAADGLPCWYLDPVDGTTNFANGLPWSSFSLALVVDGVPVVGVVADPWRGEVFEAVAGRGARLNGELLRIPVATGEGDPLSGRVVSTELAGHLPWPGMLGLLEALGRRNCTMRIMGSGTLTLTGVAAGRGVGSVIGSFGPVDHLAAVLIVTEAGGTVLDTSGEPNLFPAAGGILAAAPHAASALYDLWQETLPGE